VATGDHPRSVVRTGKRAVRAAGRGAGSLVGGRRALPDLLIVGTQRGGTTTLFKILLDHPQVGGSGLHKEVHYFDLNAERNERWYRAHFPRERTVERRRATFGSFVVGEATPYYLFHPLAAERARRVVPGARVIAILRHPVERARSQHAHETELGYEPLSFEDALGAEAERTAGEEERLIREPSYRSFEHQHHAYVARSEYGRQLERWRSAFPPERILVLVSEELFADPRGTFGRVTSFLGIEDRDPGLLPRLNASSAGSLRPETRERLWERLAPEASAVAELIGRDPGWRP
jgi:hypothetical protein